MNASVSPGRLAENLMHFARLLRACGLPLGTDRIALALQALPAIDLGERADMRAALRACLIDRFEHSLIFDQAFDLFWRDPDLQGQMMRMLLPQVASRAADARSRNRRLDAATSAPAPRARRPPPPEERPAPVAASGTWSDLERLRKADFETMSAAEWRQARALLERIRPFRAERRTRRHRLAERGRRLDLAAALRASARRGGDIVALPRRQPRTRPEAIVAIVDISGSVSRYSRVFLHFLHAMSSADRRMESFVFGTRLTRVTRLLASRDPDAAIERVVGAVDDWEGGTRITRCLEEFNRRWARRVLSSGPTVLLMTDGLEVADARDLSRQAERLAKSCRRLAWLNPLLRYKDFEPRAQGIRAMLPHVDRLLPVHNIESLDDLAKLLATAGTR